MKITVEYNKPINQNDSNNLPFERTHFCHEYRFKKDWLILDHKANDSDRIVGLTYIPRELILGFKVEETC